MYTVVSLHVACMYLNMYMYMYVFTAHSNLDLSIRSRQCLVSELTARFQHWLVIKLFVGGGGGA